ncbi:DinB family protein [Nocardia sp. NPDC050712]|uniref:DinB family protein n=1 Tax=Nocardia sp. NPDC050712 TaxID=3155518 RepID=UPI0033D42869
MDTCAECGFVYDLTRATDVAALAREQVVDYADLLLVSDAANLRRRPEPEVWSPLEYACHMRDVLFVQRERVLAARRLPTPEATPMGRDERVEHDGYADQRPTDVGRQIRDAAELFANVLDRLTPEDWNRTLIYSFPAREERSISWLAVHTLHELRHHLLDMRRQLVS